MITPEDLLDAKILIVDDSPDNVDLLLAMLSHEGYRNVYSTTLPVEVVEMHRLHQFDLILLDIQMPDMDGFDVMAGLRELERDAWLPVLAITAQPAYKLRALDAGAKDFISKPFDFLEVLQRIRNMLEVRLLYKQATQTSVELQRLALQDPLTGLPNRRLLQDRIGTAIEHARRNRGLVAVMYIDLDGFKQVNDTWGHDHGDILLQEVSSRLVEAARREDTVARLGGDEFVVALGEIIHQQDVLIPAAKLIHAIAAPYFIKNQRIEITTSIGISLFPDNANDADQLLLLADRALYQAKHAGKNRFHVSTESHAGQVPAQHLDESNRTAVVAGVASVQGVSDVSGVTCGH